jgi:hypothetical protein
MHWAAAIYATTIWLLAASFWQMYMPAPDDASHRDVAGRVFRDIVPAVLIGILVGRVL